MPDSPLTIDDRPPDFERIQRADETRAEYNPNITYWPPLVAGAIGVFIVASFLHWWITSLPNMSKDANLKPQVEEIDDWR